MVRTASTSRPLVGTGTRAGVGLALLCGSPRGCPKQRASPRLRDPRGIRTPVVGPIVLSLWTSRPLWEPRFCSHTPPGSFNYTAEKSIRTIRPRPFFISHRKDPRGGPPPQKWPENWSPELMTPDFRSKISNPTRLAGSWGQLRQHKRPKL